MPPHRAARWDLFCTVVDNFGDAGIAWRLARELRHDHGLDVTLWIDDPRALSALAGADPGATEQRVSDIAIRARDTWRSGDLPDAIVEVLGCGVPAACIDAMRASPRPPRWFVLEYLSAESWVDDRHALPSPHPATGLARRFWFPGFTARTGGLLRERDLFERREAFLRDPGRHAALWRTLGVAPVPPAWRVSLFCYADAPLAPLLDAWKGAREPIACFVPEGPLVKSLAAWTGGAMPQPGAPLRRGQLALHVVPFVPQDRYDELLWSCDFNFVRGEDSFVRAQWAARPLAWHIYRQAADAHRVKLAAFLDRYTQDRPAPPADALRALWMAWNASPGGIPLGAAWEAIVHHGDVLRAHAARWACHLAQLPELATTLVESTHGTV